MSIAFIDLQAQRRRIGQRMTDAILAAVEGGAWVMGPQVKQFEKDLAAFGQAAHALGCGNGTDALALPLMAWGVGRGDAVFVPSFTFAATAEIVPWFDAEPVFVDVEPRTYNMDPEHLQAAILIEKLNVYAAEIEMRNRVAARYNEALRPHVAAVPDTPEGNVSNWAQYTIEHENRDGLAAHLKAQGVPTAVYYPMPLHLQPAYERFPQGPQGLPTTERLKDRVISLPMHSDLDEATQDRVIEAVASFKG